MWPDERNASLTNWKNDEEGTNAKAEDLEMWKLPRSGEMVSKFHYEDRVSRFSTEILDGWLFLGNAENAASATQMMKYPGFKMTHCLNCRMNGSTPFKGDITYCVLKLVDEPAEDLIKQVNIAFDFIDGVRKSGGKILVHCDGEYNPSKKGCSTFQSRASAVVIGYLMKSKKVKGYKAAAALVGKQRKKMFQKNVKPNHGFQQQLQKMAKRL